MVMLEKEEVVYWEGTHKGFWMSEMFFFTVLFPDMGSNECANHVSFH